MKKKEFQELLKRGLNILLIEDNKNDAELALRNLKQFTVTVVHTLKDGLAALDSKQSLESGQFDVVILDLGLTNGLKNKVLDEVNAKRGKAATVILTGDHNPRTRDHMMLRGADGYAVKGRDDASPEDMRCILFIAMEHREGRK